jgi:hypothetical protein
MSRLHPDTRINAVQIVAGICKLKRDDAEYIVDLVLAVAEEDLECEARGVYPRTYPKENV